MNLLVIDCAVSRLSLGLKACDNFFSYTYDIGMKQSEILVPVLEKLLHEANIKKNELDYTALTIGPGSFTGLRLGISALKAVELAYKVPVFGISSLQVYSHPFESLGLPVISGIDANKDKFYTRIIENSNIILNDGDYDLSYINEKLKGISKAIVAGPNAPKLKSLLSEMNKEINLLTLNTNVLTTESLIQITEDLISKGEKPLQDYDGPVYLRASEAELALLSK